MSRVFLGQNGEYDFIHVSSSHEAQKWKWSEQLKLYVIYLHDWSLINKLLTL